MAAPRDAVGPAWHPWALSTGMHGVLLAVLAGGVVLTRLAPPTETALALEAVVVDARTLAALQRATAPRPAPPPVAEPVPEPAPPPSRTALAERVPPSAVSPQAVQPVSSAKPTTVPRPDPKPVPTSTAASPPAPRPVPDVPDVAAREAAEREAAERELQAALAEEERLMALRASGAAAQWSAAIRGRVQRAWIRPDTARSGIDCTVAVTQAPGGTVLAVEVRTCNGDEAVRQSIEDAVRRASPLPSPPDPALFEREIILRFRPDA